MNKRRRPAKEAELEWEEGGEELEEGAEEGEEQGDAPSKRKRSKRVRKHSKKERGEEATEEGMQREGQLGSAVLERDPNTGSVFTLHSWLGERGWGDSVSSRAVGGMGRWLRGFAWHGLRGAGWLRPYKATGGGAHVSDWLPLCRGLVWRFRAVAQLLMQASVVDGSNAAT